MCLRRSGSPVLSLSVTTKISVCKTLYTHEGKLCVFDYFEFLVGFIRLKDMTALRLAT